MADSVDTQATATSEQDTQQQGAQKKIHTRRSKRAHGQAQTRNKR